MEVLLYLHNSTRILIIMSSPGQKRGTCSHVMALYNSHKKCARCREKGVGDDLCVKKMDCQICKAFMPVQIQQLSTPTYKSRKERNQKKTGTDSPASATPTHVEPSEVTLLGRVHKESAFVESTPPGKKKKRSDDSPKPSSKKKSSSKPRSDGLKDLDEKRSEHCARLEAMLLSKSFAVPVEPVRKPASVVTSDQPFFYPGTSTSVHSSGVTFEGASPSLAQTTGEIAASKSATRPVEGPGTGVLATQPVEAPGAGPEALLTDTGNTILHAEQTSTSGKTVNITSGSDSDGDLQSEPGSPVDDNFRDGSPDRDFTRDESADQELSEEASYRETIRGVRSFMGWHQPLARTF